MADNVKSRSTSSKQSLTVQEAISIAHEFIESVVEGANARVEGATGEGDGGWSVKFAAFLSNPNLGVEIGNMKSEVFDEVSFVVTVDANGTVRNMTKA